MFMIHQNFILLSDSYQKSSLSCCLVGFMVTSPGSLQSVVWSIITAEWECFEGTKWWKDLRLNWVNSRGPFQHLLKSGLTVRLDQVSVVLPLSSIFGENRFVSFWCGRKFSIFHYAILVCFNVFLSMWKCSIFHKLKHFCFGQSYLLISQLPFSSLLCFLSYGLVKQFLINSLIYCE